MKRVVLWLLALLPAALVAGCSGAEPVNRPVEADGGPRVEAATSVAGRGTEGLPEATVGVVSTDEAAASNVGARTAGEPFVASPETDGGSGYDADTLLGVRYGVHRGYERVVLDLGTGEEPAEAVPRWTLISPKGDGLLRVTLPSVSATGVSDGGFGDGLLGSFHVVRAPEGGMFVDVFARRAFLYRVLELEDPSRIAVDFKPTGNPLKVPLPASGGDTVLVEPRRGAAISGTLTVSGYSRNFEASNTIVLTGPGDEVVARRTVQGNDWSSTWGYFEATLDLPPFTGGGTLQVGTRNARNGSFEGVRIPVRGE